jgi:hypothetical protein
MSTVGPSDHLAQLEAESIDIMREVIAQCAKPVMLYSIGRCRTFSMRRRPPRNALLICRGNCRHRAVTFHSRRLAPVG